MFGKVWYEGYAKPEYVWQSTGGTDDFEPKMSLVPLIFGTIKATFYALVFAIPLAVFGALYTSQFVHPSIKAKVKPTVEIMAALPSVVIGFIAGLWLASRVEAHLVPVLLLILFLPLAGTAGVLFWDRLPYELRRRLRPGMELFVILPLLVAGCRRRLRDRARGGGRGLRRRRQAVAVDGPRARLRPAQQRRGRPRAWASR